MSDLTAFLNARLDEDEAAANEVHRPRECGSVDGDGEFSADPIYCSCVGPARVLREVEAKRAILAEHARDPEAAYGKRGHMCGSGGYSRNDCRTVRLLAAVYSDHPDYRPEWKP